MIINPETLLNVDLLFLIRDILLGIVIGMAIGMTGVGGGALVQPALIHIVGLSPVLSVGSGLAFALITKMSGLLAHLKLKTINSSLTFYCAIGSIPGVLLSSKVIAYLINNFDEKSINTHLQLVMAYVLLITAGVTILQMIYRKEKLQQNRTPNNKKTVLNFQRKFNCIGSGFLIGILIGGTSLGGGVLIIFYLMVFLNAPTLESIGTSIAISLIVSSFGAVVYIYGGFVDFQTTIFLSIGSIPGVYVGSIIAVKIPEKILKIILICIIIVSGISLFFGVSSH